MKRYITYCLLTLAALGGIAPSASAQIYDAEGQYVDTVFHDHIDRTADDFVIASLVVAEPGTHLYSVLGHACLRMQCPAFDLDYCFSYESEDAGDKVFSFLDGNLNMGLFRIPFSQYCDIYAGEGRGVVEYELNLTPQQKQNLWEILDRHVQQDTVLPYDYYHRGCANSCVRFVREAIAPAHIDYAPWPAETPTGRDLVKRNTEDVLWTRFLLCFISGSEVDEPLEGEQSLLIPKDLALAWQHASIEGRPLIVKDVHVIVESTAELQGTLISPTFISLCLLLLVILGWYFHVPYADWLILSIVTIGGLFLSYLIFVSDLCCTGWNWLFIPFNPLPAILWHWRRYWSAVYAVVLAIWLCFVCLYPHTLIDTSHGVLVLAMLVMYIKQWRISNRDK